jgi:ABC-type methionine transport system ATPase subunit
MKLTKVLDLPNDEIENRVKAVLEAVNLSDKIDSYLENYLEDSSNA